MQKKPMQNKRHVRTAVLLLKTNKLYVEIKNILWIMKSSVQLERLLPYNNKKGVYFTCYHSIGNYNVK